MNFPCVASNFPVSAFICPQTTPLDTPTTGSEQTGICGAMAATHFGIQRLLSASLDSRWKTHRSEVPPPQFVASQLMAIVSSGDHVTTYFIVACPCRYIWSGKTVATGQEQHLPTPVGSDGCPPRSLDVACYHVHVPHPAGSTPTCRLHRAKEEGFEQACHLYWKGNQ